MILHLFRVLILMDFICNDSKNDQTELSLKDWVPLINLNKAVRTTQLRYGSISYSLNSRKTSKTD